MIVRVLGSAAGGGVPQWNCACSNCSAARAGTQPRRSSSGFAISGDGERWWLINVSPDVAQQIEAFSPLQPRAGRGTPIAGVLVTDANVDHLGGFAVLRQTGDHAFATYSTETVRAIALEQPAFATFARPPHAWRALAPHEEVALDATLRARLVPTAGLTPGYAGRRARADAVAAYLVTDACSAKSALFAPVFADPSEALIDAAREADVAFFDGSFWSDDELASVGPPKAARSLGHAPIGGSDGSLAILAGAARRGAAYFAHVNNTNPLLDPHSAAARELGEAGFTVAYDGLEIFL